jgi:hypothetical protein
MEKMIALIEYEEYNHLGIEEASTRLYYKIDRELKKLFIEKENSIAGYRRSSDSQNRILEFPISDTDQSDKHILHAWLIQFFSQPHGFIGLPYFCGSALFTQVEFDEIQKSAKENMNRKEARARFIAKGNSLILFCESRHLYPRPSLHAETSWMANCPTGRSHNMEISLATNKWGCGYCGIGGVLTDLIDFMNTKKKN